VFAAIYTLILWLHYMKSQNWDNMLYSSLHSLQNSVCVPKTKYMIMSRDQKAGRSHSVRFDNSSIERVEEFKYLGTTLTNQNSIQEEIRSRLNLGNACYYSVQSLLSSSLLSKNLKIKISFLPIALRPFQFGLDFPYN